MNMKSYSVIGVLSSHKEMYTVKMMAVLMDKWREIDFKAQVRYCDH